MAHMLFDSLVLSTSLLPTPVLFSFAMLILCDLSGEKEKQANLLQTSHFHQRNAIQFLSHADYISSSHADCISLGHADCIQVMPIVFP